MGKSSLDLATVVSFLGILPNALAVVHLVETLPLDVQLLGLQAFLFSKHTSTVRRLFTSWIKARRKTLQNCGGRLTFVPASRKASTKVKCSTALRET